MTPDQARKIYFQGEDTVVNRLCDFHKEVKDLKRTVKMQENKIAYLSVRLHTPLSAQWQHAHVEYWREYARCIYHLIAYMIIFCKIFLGKVLNTLSFLKQEH